MLPLLIIFSLLVPSNAIASIKSGGTCKKIGQTNNYLGQTYTCVLSGKKFIWNKGVKEQPKITKPGAAKTISKLTIAQGYSVDIVDLDMVNGGSLSAFSSEYVQKVSEAAPQYAEQYCNGLLKEKSEVLIKEGFQTLGVSYFKPLVVFAEKSEKTSSSGGQYLNWNYYCFLQADFTSIKEAAFYDIYVQGIRVATEPYSNLVKSDFRLIYPSSKSVLCITGNTPVMSGLLRCG